MKWLARPLGIFTDIFIILAVLGAMVISLFFILNLTEEARQLEQSTQTDVL